MIIKRQCKFEMGNDRAVCVCAYTPTIGGREVIYHVERDTWGGYMKSLHRLIPTLTVPRTMFEPSGMWRCSWWAYTFIGPVKAVARTNSTPVIIVNFRLELVNILRYVLRTNSYKCEFTSFFILIVFNYFQIFPILLLVILRSDNGPLANA